MLTNIQQYLKTIITILIGQSLSCSIYSCYQASAGKDCANISIFPESPRQFQNNLHQLYNILKKLHNNLLRTSQIMESKISRYYKILNVKESCSDLQLRRAYRRLALQIHPDKSLDKSTQHEFLVLNKIYTRLVAYRRKNNDINQLVIHNTPIPMYYESQNINEEIQQRFQKHMQTLDNILQSLKIMSNNNNKAAQMFKIF